MSRTTRRHVVHRSPESVFVSQSRLLKRDGTAQRGLKRKALLRGDVIENPLLELNVYCARISLEILRKEPELSSDCAVVRVEPFNAKG
jgi:hypothetical protein